jgi:hypothetical protein
MRMGTSGTTKSLGLSLTAKNVSTLVHDEDVVVAGICGVAELFAADMKAVVEREFLARRTDHLARLQPVPPGTCDDSGQRGHHQGSPLCSGPPSGSPASSRGCPPFGRAFERSPAPVRLTEGTQDPRGSEQEYWEAGVKCFAE